MKVTYRFDIRQPVITPEGNLGTVVTNFTNDRGNFALVCFPSGPVVEQRAYEDRVLLPAIAPQQ